MQIMNSRGLRVALALLPGAAGLPAAHAADPAGSGAEPAIVYSDASLPTHTVYLLGHSMGGFGTWWLGQKHAERWAAIAPMSGVLPNVDYHLPRLKSVPVHISIGGKENPDWVAASREQVDTMRAAGMIVGYFEPAQETHGSMIAPTLPRALEFFADKVRR